MLNLLWICVVDITIELCWPKIAHKTTCNLFTIDVPQRNVKEQKSESAATIYSRSFSHVIFHTNCGKDQIANLPWSPFTENGIELDRKPEYFTGSILMRLELFSKMRGKLSWNSFENTHTKMQTGHEYWKIWKTDFQDYCIWSVAYISS